MTPFSASASEAQNSKFKIQGKFKNQISKLQVRGAWIEPLSFRLPLSFEP
jgi:hypothetical protein